MRRNPLHGPGVPPTRPETGFGYIRRHGEPGTYGEHSVAQFAEKPSAETAAAYLASGDYAWNGGMFVMKASFWLKALAHYRPDIAAATGVAWTEHQLDPPFIRPGKAAFAAIPAESIDYAVMEHCPGSAFPIKMVPLAAGWSDLGAWDVVWQVAAQDAAGNVTRGDTLTAGTTNTLIHATSRLVARWASTTWSSSRPPTPCWWPRATRRRT